MISAVARPIVFLLALLSLGVTSALAQVRPVWQIGVDEDPFQYGYNATDEFSWENYINDVRPGQAVDNSG